MTIRIAIIGAGPAGCTLAKLLLHKNVPVDITIFEGEKGLDARTQGGTLDLHTDTGIEALKQCGLYDEFLKYARFDGEALQVCNKYFQRFISFGGTSNAKDTRGRPEIDRLQLRQILIDSLPEDVIRWDHHLTGIDKAVDGKYQLHFRNRPTAESGFDLIVGAEGCWSKTRDLVTDEKPYYSGISGFSFHISDPETRCPELYKRVNRGSLFAFHGGKSVMVQQTGGGFLICDYWALNPEDWIKRVSTADDLEAMKAISLEEVSDCDPRLREILEYADCDAMAKNLYMLPVGIRWAHKSGVTLIGDAAHVMTPFAGEGVNLAMSDSLSLAAHIERAASQGDAALALDGEVSAFEEKMFARAKKYQQMTYDMMTAMYHDSAQGVNVERWVITAASDQMPGVLLPVFKVAVYCYFWFWRLVNRPPR